MAEILLVKTQAGLRGMTPEDENARLAFHRMVDGLGEGELVKLKHTCPRLSWKHRKFFAMLTVGFEHWEPVRKRKTYKGRPIEKNFEQFRKDVTILAGFYDQAFDLTTNKMTLTAKSIAFDKMEQDEFDQLYNAVANVLLKDVLSNYTRADLDRVVDQLIHF